jgi:putative ABC transport system permease protein
MRLRDLLQFGAESLLLHRVRTTLTLTGIAVGVIAVLVLTALGEGARRYVVQEFSGMGTGILIVIPGKVETQGAGPVVGGTTRDLTVEDAEAVARRCPSVSRVAPVSFGSTAFEYGGRSRQIPVIGSTTEILTIRNLEVTTGRFPTADDIRRGERVAVIGRTIQREVFRGDNPLGKAVRLGGYRLRVVGVLAHKGRSLGFDMDDIVIVPVATALRMFNQRSLFRVLVQARGPEAVDRAEEQVKVVLRERHDDEEDFTVITQGAMLDTFHAVLGTLTAALAGIAAISLAVAGIGIMNVMLVSVSERRGEIGLLKALGASRRQILTVFLIEALALAGIGALLGVIIGVSTIYVAVAVYPVFPAQASLGWIAVVVLLCFAAGAGFGMMPARRAARLSAADSLRGWVTT